MLGARGNGAVAGLHSIYKWKVHAPHFTHVLEMFDGDQFSLSLRGKRTNANLSQIEVYVGSPLVCHIAAEFPPHEHMPSMGWVRILEVLSDDRCHLLQREWERNKRTYTGAARVSALQQICPGPLAHLFCETVIDGLLRKTYCRRSHIFLH